MYLASRDVVPAATAGRHGCMGGRWEPDGSSHGRVLAGTVDGSIGPPMGGARPMGAFLVVDNLAP